MCTNHSDIPLLSRIADHLLINASFMNSLGLYHGKMGAVLFFAHYARYSGKPMYDDMAGELMDEIYEHVHTDMLLDFEDGLYGIGWGISYLLQHELMNGDPVLVLGNLDTKIMERDIRRISVWNENDGLGGILNYVMSRIDLSLRKQAGAACFDSTYLRELEDICKHFLHNHKSVDEHIRTRQLAVAFLDYREKKSVNKAYLFSFQELLRTCVEEADDLTKLPVGLSGGCVGVGLKSIML